MKMNYELNNIFAMDETAVWNGMVSNTTVEKRGAHSVNLKSTGHEKSKITVCLTATASLAVFHFLFSFCFSVV